MKKLPRNSFLEGLAGQLENQIQSIVKKDDAKKDPQHTPTRKAKIGIGSNFNSQTFEYANGTPGDLVIPITPSEIKAWKHIVRAVNAHEELIEAAKAAVRHLEACEKNQIGHPFKSASLPLLKDAIARAEGK